MTSNSRLSFAKPTRSLAERLGDLPTKGWPLKEQVSIYWSSYQVPFIEARHDEDAALALGAVHAHLRLVQMELLRRLSAGRLSEMFGSFTVKLDHSLRVLNLGAKAPEIRAALPEDTHHWLEAFVSGINYYQEHTRRLPPEYKRLGLEKEPWTIEDIIRLGRLMAVDVNWLIWSQLLPLREKKAFAAVWRRILDNASASLPSFESAESGNLWELLAGAAKTGSNAFAVSGGRSTSGSALLAADPHVAFQIPNVWLLAGIHCPGYHTLGLMFPGIPFAAIGRNEKIAWGGTNMWALSSALFDVSTVPSSDFKERIERIKVRCWRDRQVKIRESTLGPVISDAPALKHYRGPPLALKWLGHEVSDEFTAFLKVNRAANWQEFRGAFESYGVSGQNMIYGDRDGSIGQMLAVRFAPAASKIDRDFVQKPPADKESWGRVLNSTELPAAFNPAGGVLVSANNVPVQLEPPLGRAYPSNDRFLRIQELLSRESRLDLDELKGVQRDVYGRSSAELCRVLLERLAGLERLKDWNAGEKQLIAELGRWDGCYLRESRGAVAFTLLAYHLSSLLYTRLYGAEFSQPMLRAGSVFEFMKMDLDGLESTVQAELVEQALSHAAAEFGSFPNWGEMHRLRLEHPLARIPLIGRSFSFLDTGVDGSASTVMKSAHHLTNRRHYARYGAVARFCCDLADLNANYFVLAGGQDGFIGSANMLDQVELWQRGEYLKIPLEIGRVRAEFSHLSVMEPAV